MSNVNVALYSSFDTLKLRQYMQRLFKATPRPARPDFG
jgi:hypothetical protein